MSYITILENLPLNKNMKNSFEIGDVVVFKANKNIQLIITGIGADGLVLLRFFDNLTNEFKKVEMPAICFIKVEQDL